MWGAPVGRDSVATPAHAPRDGSNSHPRDSVFGTFFSPDEPSPNEWKGAGAGGGWGGAGRTDDADDAGGSGGGGAPTSATTTAAGAGARTSPSTTTTTARAGMGRRLGRRRPEATGGWGYDRADEHPNTSGWGASDPPDARDAHPTAWAADPSGASDKENRAHQPHRARLDPAASPPAASSPPHPAPKPSPKPAPAPAPARRAHAWKTDWGVGAPAARRRSADEDAATDARGTRASPRRLRRTSPSLSPSPSLVRADASAQRQPKRRRARLAAIESDSEPEPEPEPEAEAEAEGERAPRAEDGDEDLEDSDDEPLDAGLTRSAPHKRPRASSAVTNAAAAVAAGSSRAPFTLERPVATARDVHPAASSGRTSSDRRHGTEGKIKRPKTKAAAGGETQGGDERERERERERELETGGEDDEANVRPGVASADGRDEESPVNPADDDEEEEEGDRAGTGGGGRDEGA